MISKEKVLRQIADGFGSLEGTMRSVTASMQIDRWKIGQDYFLVTTQMFWEPTGPGIQQHVYNYEYIKRIEKLNELMTELPKL